jgi:hypothetical protein
MTVTERTEGLVRRAIVAATALTVATCAVVVMGPASLPVVAQAPPLVAQAPPPEVVPCGFGLFCGPIDQEGLPPIRVAEPWDRVVQGADTADAWASLEAQAKAAVAAMHEVPNDRRIGDFARDEVRAAMFQLLVAAIRKQAAGDALTFDEVDWIAAMGNLVRERRIAGAQAALDEYGRWERNPCSYQPPAGFGFARYNIICTPQQTTFDRPPTEGQFTAYGTALAQIAVLNDADAEAAAEAAIQGLLLLASIGTGGLAAAVTAGLVVSSSALAVAIAGALGSASVTTAALAAGVGAATGFAVAASVSILLAVVISAAVVAIAAWQLADAAEVPVRLQERLVAARATIPNLAELIGTDAGRNEMFGLFLGETLPDFATQRAASTTPMSHRAGVDPLFRDTTSLDEQVVLRTLDWDSRVQETYLADGWFVTRPAGGSYEWATTLQYRNGEGRPSTAFIRNGEFLISQQGLGDSASPAIVDTELWVSDPDAPGASRTVEWRGNQRPTVNVQVTDNLTENSTLRFSATTSDPDGDDVELLWYLQPDDQLVPQGCIDLSTGATTLCTWPPIAGSSADVRYRQDGIYVGRVVATDERGASTTQTFEYRVRNVAPTLTVDTPISVSEGGAVRLSGQFTDPGDDPMTVTIDWGDGSPPVSQQYPCASAPRPDGTCAFLLFVPAQDPTAWFRTHVYAQPGTYTVTVTANDNGNSTQTSVLVDTVAPVASPTLAPAASATGWHSGAVTVTWNWADVPGSGVNPASCPATSTSSGVGAAVVIVGSCTDVAGNTATISRTVKIDAEDDSSIRLDVAPTTPIDSANTTVTAIVTGAGAPATGTVQFAIDSQPLGDPVALTDGRAVRDLGRLARGTYLITASFAGNDEYSPASVSQSLVVGAAPIAGDDTYTIDEDAPETTFDVLSNDRDADGDTLSIVANTAAQRGVVTCSSTSCTYRPNPNANGSDSFTYTVTDGSFTAVATVRITVTPVEDAPAATTSRGVIRAAGGGITTINVLDGIVDPDGDEVIVVSFTQPRHGTVTCTPAGRCQYTPNVGYSGPDSFSVTVGTNTPASAGRLFGVLSLGGAELLTTELVISLEVAAAPVAGETPTAPVAGTPAAPPVAGTPGSTAVGQPDLGARLPETGGSPFAALLAALGLLVLGLMARAGSRTGRSRAHVSSDFAR